MDGDGSGLSGRSPRLEGRMPRHRISRALVLHCDVVPTSTFVERGEPTSADHGIRATRCRLPPQTAGRLHPDLTLGSPTIYSSLGNFPPTCDITSYERDFRDRGSGAMWRRQQQLSATKL